MAEKNLAAELERCDREIIRIEEEARNGNPDVHGILQGLHDWRYEKRLIMKEQSAQSEPVSLADPQPVERDALSTRCDYQ